MMKMKMKVKIMEENRKEGLINILSGDLGFGKYLLFKMFPFSR